MQGRLHTNEFSAHTPVKRRGFSTVEAGIFLRQEFPDVETWMCWSAVGTEAATDLARVVGQDKSGRIGPWTWERVEADYPSIGYWVSDENRAKRDARWVGAIRVHNDGVGEFILFSCLDSSGDIGRFYFVSTEDRELLSRFARDLHAFLSQDEEIIVERPLRSDLKVSADEEALILDKTMQRDIEQQVETFFKNPDVYHDAGIPYRRGFLFVGPPGTGKTMMVRRILRQCKKIGGISFLSLPMIQNVDDDDVEVIFGLARQRAPSLLILEDVDSLTTDTKVTRAGFLAQLDGISPQEGVLIIGTTNHPEKIDPALSHRPCRFDRVWKFGLPDTDLRRQYLETMLGIESGTTKDLLQRTEGWSFAYLNEMRTTATLMAVTAGRKKPGLPDIQAAADLLADQHRSGERGHEIVNSKHTVGFVAA